MIAVIVVSSVPSGCGGAKYQSPAVPEESPEPSATPESDGRIDVGSLEADLEREERALRSLLGFGPDQEPPAEPAMEAGVPEPPVAVPPQDAQTGGVGLSTEAKHKSERCDRVCRALQSMRRAAEGICRLSADEEPDRCDKARSRVDESTGFVERSGCVCS
jgi:hypothetical protein